LSTSSSLLPTIIPVNAKTKTGKQKTSSPQIRNKEDCSVRKVPDWDGSWVADLMGGPQT